MRRAHWPISETFAPHECDADCPGDINRRKLALFEEMVAALNELDTAEKPDTYYQWSVIKRKVTPLLARAREIGGAI